MKGIHIFDLISTNLHPQIEILESRVADGGRRGTPVRGAGKLSRGSRGGAQIQCVTLKHQDLTSDV